MKRPRGTIMAFRVTADERAQIEAAAQREDRTASYIVRRVVLAHLTVAQQRTESAEDRAQVSRN